MKYGCSMEANTDIQHGYRVEDTISGFEGIVTLIGDHISGCTRFGVHPVDDSKRGSQEFFFEEQLEVVDQETDFVDFDVETDVHFELGDVVYDEVTGFRGVVTVINYKLWNSPKVHIQSSSETATTEEQDSMWLDDMRVVTTGDSTDFDASSRDNYSNTGPVSDSADENLSA